MSSLNSRSKEAYRNLKKGYSASIIPHYMQKGITEYVLHGRKPGDFLCALLKNDLMGAAGRADGGNIHLLGEYAKLLYNHVPYGCYGSEENFDAWIEQGGLQ